MAGIRMDPMRVLLDTNVVLDALLQRAPWVAEADAIWQAKDAGRLQAYVSASALTDIFYITRRLTDLGRARAFVRLCLDSLEICPVDRSTLESAEVLPGPD